MDGSEYNNLLRYLTKKVYNEKLTANDKRALRKRKDASLVYTNIFTVTINNLSCFAANINNLSCLFTCVTNYYILPMIVSRR
jgi:hypothetical protein